MSREGLKVVNKQTIVSKKAAGAFILPNGIMARADRDANGRVVRQPATKLTKEQLAQLEQLVAESGNIYAKPKAKLSKAAATAAASRRDHNAVLQAGYLGCFGTQIFLSELINGDKEVSTRTVTDHEMVRN